MTKKLLTEAEILKMSDKDYMNEDQLAFFKNRLEQLQAEILRNAGQTTENLRETVIVPDPADRATIEEEHALELRTRDRERKLLKKVQQSLARIESGDYGWCEETGEPIGIPVCSHVRRLRCRSRRRSAASCVRSCSATDTRPARPAFRAPHALSKARGLPRAFAFSPPHRPAAPAARRP
ncbi:hypothetical protein NCM_05673 [Burkholderia pseudomallei]